MDHFDEPRLQALQMRAITTADRVFVVSRTWADRLASLISHDATVVGNGVDMERYSPQPAAADAILRARLDLGAGPILLSVGGIEQRKNSIRILEAFRQLHAIHPGAQLLIAGGASVLDHQAYQDEFRARFAALGIPKHAVIFAGVMADAEMPSLYRLADALVFASVREGFGLVVLEAMASGLPVVASHIAPFTEYLGDDDVIWCDPLSVASIANAMASILVEPLRSRLSERGFSVARRHEWPRTAHAHVPVYETMREMNYA